MTDVPQEPEDGPPPRRRKRSYTTRTAEKRAELTRQSWPDFFRDLAVRTAIVTAVVAVLVLVLWLAWR